MKIVLNDRKIAILMLLLVINSNTKILSSSELHPKSLKLNDKKEKVNNIMMRALTGVLAKKALTNALSKEAREKLQVKEAQERNLMDLKSHTPKKNNRMDNNYWAKAEKAMHKKNKQ